MDASPSRDSAHRVTAGQTKQHLLPLQDVQTPRPGLPRVRQAGQEQPVANHETDHRSCASDLAGDLNERQTLLPEPERQLLLLLRENAPHVQPPETDDHG